MIPQSPRALNTSRKLQVSPRNEAKEVSPKVKVLFETYKKSPDDIPENKEHEGSQPQRKRIKLFSKIENSGRTQQQHQYPTIRVLSSKKSGSVTERSLVTRERNSRQIIIEHNGEVISRGDSMSLVQNKELPNCLKSVIDDQIKIKKLRKDLKDIKEELSVAKLNLKIPYHFGLIHENVFELCCNNNQELGLVDHDQEIPAKIYGQTNLGVITQKIVKKVIRYQGIKERLKYLNQHPSEKSYHKTHLITEKVRLYPPFRLNFDKQTRRPSVVKKSYAPDPQKLEGAKSERHSRNNSFRKTFQSDELRKTHNFESYIERKFILKNFRSLHSSPRHRTNILA